MEITMGFIQIPEGKTEVRLKDGSWSKVPEGKTKVDSDALWQEDSSSSDMKYLKDELIDATELEEKKEPKPDVGTQYLIGTLSKVSDRETRFKNVKNLVEKRGYELVDAEDKPLMEDEGGKSNINHLIPTPYKYTLKDKKTGELKYIDESGFQQGFMEVLGDAGEITGTIVGLAIGKSPLAGAVGASAGNLFIDQVISSWIADEETDYKDKAREVGKTFALTYIPEKAIQGVANVAGRAGDYVGEKKIASMIGLTTEEIDIAKKANIPLDKAYNIVKDLPKEERALALGSQGTGKTKGYMEGALDSEDIKDKYGEILDARRKAFAETIQMASFSEKKKIASNYFQGVKDLFSDMPTETPFDGSVLIDTVEQLKSSVSTSSKAEGLIEKMATIYADRPVNNIGEIIDLRMAINHEMNRAQGNSKSLWKNAKDSVDDWLSKNVDSNIAETLDKSNALYSTMKSTEEVIEAFKKVTKPTTKGAGADHGEIGAVDWTELHKALADVYVASPEIKSSMELTESFMKKYGDMDAELFGRTVSKAEQEGAGDIITGKPRGHMERLANIKLFEAIKRYIPTTAGFKQRKAQEAIRHSIENSSSQVEFLRNVRRHPDTIQQTKQEIDILLEGIDTSAKGLAKKRFESKKLIKQAQNTQLRLNTADNAIDKATLKVDSKHNTLFRLEASKKPNEEAIEQARKQLEIAERDLELKVQNHSKISEEFDSLNLQLDDMNMFMNPKDAAARPRVNTKKDLP